jgi:hypothetical protein
MALEKTETAWEVVNVVSREYSDKLDNDGFFKKRLKRLSNVWDRGLLTIEPRVIQ